MLKWNDFGLSGLCDSVQGWMELISPAPGSEPRRRGCWETEVIIWRLLAKSVADGGAMSERHLHFIIHRNLTRWRRGGGDRVALHASRCSCLSLANPSTLAWMCFRSAYIRSVCVCVCVCLDGGACETWKCVCAVMNVTGPLAACERKMISRCCEKVAQTRRVLNTHFKIK